MQSLEDASNYKLIYLPVCRYSVPLAGDFPAKKMLDSAQVGAIHTSFITAADDFLMIMSEH